MPTKKTHQSTWNIYKAIKARTKTIQKIAKSNIPSFT